LGRTRSTGSTSLPSGIAAPSTCPGSGANVAPRKYQPEFSSGLQTSISVHFSGMAINAPSELEP